MKDSVIMLHRQVDRLSAIASKLEQSRTLVKIEPQKVGRVIDWVKMGYNFKEENNFRHQIEKRKVAIMKDDKPALREVSISATVDYLRVIDTSNAGKEYVLSFDEIIQLAEQQGLFR